MPKYNHYQRPMSQAMDKRVAANSSMMSTQRTSDQLGDLELKPQICSIPLIDKQEQYEALLKLQHHEVCVS